MASGVSVILEHGGFGEKYLTSMLLRDRIIVLGHLTNFVTRVSYVGLFEMGGYMSSYFHKPIYISSLFSSLNTHSCTIQRLK